VDQVARPGKITADLRFVIENMWAGGASYGQIASALGVHRSSVSREVARNHAGKQGAKNPRGRLGSTGGVAGLRTGYRVGYRAVQAERLAVWRRARPKPRKLIGAHCAELRDAVAQLLRKRRSPQQAAAQLRLQHLDRPELHVSHETIYQALYIQSRGSLRELVGDSLRVKRRQRRSQSRAAQAARTAIRGKPWVTEDVHISARPAEVADRAVPGHWEGDLLIGANKRSAIITLAERTTRFVMLGHLPMDRSSPEVIAVIRHLFAGLPAALRRTLTWDQGVELAGYATYGLTEDCNVYFCDPHSPWQRGTNENTNGLLRDYFPKGRFDFTTITQTDLDTVADELNDRPRQTLQWHTPAERLNEYLRALTG
jgi:IS30 family transposase